MCFRGASTLLAIMVPTLLLCKVVESGEVIWCIVHKRVLGQPGYDQGPIRSNGDVSYSNMLVAVDLWLKGKQRFLMRTEKIFFPGLSSGQSASECWRDLS